MLNIPYSVVETLNDCDPNSILIVFVVAHIAIPRTSARIPTQTPGLMSGAVAILLRHGKRHNDAQQHTQHVIPMIVPNTRPQYKLLSEFDGALLVDDPVLPPPKPNGGGGGLKLLFGEKAGELNAGENAGANAGPNKAGKDAGELNEIVGKNTGEKAGEKAGEDTGDATGELPQVVVLVEPPFAQMSKPLDVTLLSELHEIVDPAATLTPAGPVANAPE